MSTTKTRRERSPEERERAREAGKQKAAEAVERLDAAVRRIAESDEAFAEYLRLSGRMYGYSWGNRLLIYIQRPDAGMVAGFHRWRELDRPVRKGAKGIQILAPMVRQIRVDDPELEGMSTTDGTVEGGKVRRVVGFRVAYVFSVNDTDGPDVALPEPIAVADDSAAARDALAVLLARSEQLGIPVTFATPEEDPTMRGRGYYHPAERRIVVRADMSAAERAKTLAHELAHFLAEHGNREAREDAETVAEGAAFVVMAHYGFDTTTYSAPYIAGWSQDVARVRRLLEAIARVAAEITAEEAEATA